MLTRPNTALVGQDTAPEATVCGMPVVGTSAAVRSRSGHGSCPEGRMASCARYDADSLDVMSRHGWRVAEAIAR